MNKHIDVPFFLWMLGGLGIWIWVGLAAVLFYAVSVLILISLILMFHNPDRMA